MGILHINETIEEKAALMFYFNENEKSLFKWGIN